VPSRVDRRTVIGQRAHATLAELGLQVGPEICQRSDHVNAFGAGTWVGAFAPGSPAHREIRVLKDRVQELLEAARNQAFGASPSLPAEPGGARPGLRDRPALARRCRPRGLIELQRRPVAAIARRSHPKVPRKTDLPAVGPERLSCARRVRMGMMPQAASGELGAARRGPRRRCLPACLRAHGRRYEERWTKRALRRCSTC
jgi:hypothetical protein